MPKAEKLNLRVNGRVYERVGLQYELKDGHPNGPYQAVIKDDLVAPFTLTDDFYIELQEEGRDWQRVSLLYLITLLQTYHD